MRVAIRVDGGPAIGLGHAMRSATLALALLDSGADVEILTIRLPTALAAGLEAAGATVVRGDEPLACVDADVVVVDGYHLVDELVRRGPVGRPLVMIDDNRELPVREARLVVNQNLHAELSLYADVAEDTVVLTGADYAMIRPDVVGLTDLRSIPGSRRVLVSLGGADPTRLTAPLVEALAGVSGVELTVAMRSDHPDRQRVRQLIERSHARVRFDPGDLLTGLAASDLAVIGGGTTMYEVAYLGIPAVATVVADNQRAGAQAASSRGLLVAVDEPPESGVGATVAAVRELLDDRDRRVRLSSAGRATFDGRGAMRVADAVAELVRA